MSQALSNVFKLHDVINVKDPAFGAKGDGDGVGGGTNDATAIQTVLTRALTSDGVISFATNAVYRVNSALTLQRTSAAHKKKFIIEGRGATLDFSGSGLTSGSLLKIGADTSGNAAEDGFIIIRDLKIKGVETLTPTFNNTPTSSIIGLELLNALNVYLENVEVVNSWIGFQTNFCFPLLASQCRTRVTFIGRRHQSSSNNQQWDNFQAADCRFGVIVDTTTPNKIVNIVDNTLRVEGGSVAYVADPGSGSNDRIRDLTINDPYFAGLTQDFVRLGRTVTLTDASVRGADRTAEVHNTRFKGGNWASGAGAWSVTQSALCLSSNGRVRGLYAWDFPIKDEPHAITGNILNGEIRFSSTQLTGGAFQSHSVIWDGDNDPRRVEFRRNAAGLPTSGTFNQGDILWKKDVTAATSPGWVCTTAGTFSPASTTGDTNGSTGVISNVADTSGFAPNEYVTVSAGFATTGPFRILSLTASTITVNANSNSAQVGVTISTPDPVFKTMANVAA